MSNLENLVPPLDLCRKIPPGAFEDSVLVWFGVKNHDSTMEVVPRLELGETCKMFLKKGLRILYPAPTLQEILAEIPDSTVNYDGRGRWAVQAILPSRAYGDCNANPATVALKVWLARHTETPLSWFPND